MKKILQQIPNRSFTKKKFWTSTMAMLLFFMVLGALEAQAQTQTFCPGATVSNLASTPPVGSTARWFTTDTGGTALDPTVALSTGAYYVEYATPQTITTLGSGFSVPYAVAVQADGKILVSDTGNSAIKRMNANGTGIVTVSSNVRSYGIAVQADGKILIANTINDAIIRMNADGTNIVTLGSGFNGPFGVAVQSNGKILVADSGNNAIKRMDANGTNIVTVGSGFSNPMGVAVQPFGPIMVADTGNNAIKRMNADGTAIYSIGYGFYDPRGVAVQDSNNILVADTSNNAIKRMDPDGNGLVRLGFVFNNTCGVAVLAPGNILVADTNNNEIKLITETAVSNRVLVNVVINSSVSSNFATIPAFCAGTTAPTLATTAPNGVAGTWSPATISNSASTSYVFTPTLSCNIGQTLAVTVNPIPNSPTALAIQVYAGTGTIANLTATGSTIQWYTAATAGSQLPTTALLVDGSTYYASQTVSGCESVTRVAVTVRKISEATQTLCATATVANLASSPSTGNTASWFTGLSGGTALVNAAPLTAGPYYVEQSTPLTITTLGSGFFRNTSVAVQADGKIIGGRF